MLKLLGKSWWLILLRGIAAVLFGLTALLLPDITLVTLVMLFGAYVVLDAVFNLLTAFRRKDGQGGWWVLLLEGLVGLLTGGAVLVWPEVTALVLIYLAAGWAVVTGILEIAAAVSLRKAIQGEWFLVLSGAASLIIGVILFIQPGAGMIVISWLIGIYALIFGILLLVLSLKLRSALKNHEGPAGSAA